MAAVLAFLASVVWGASDYLGGRASRRHSPVLVVGLAYAIAAASLVPVAAASGTIAADGRYLPWAAGAGVLGAIGLVAFYRALAVGTMGIVAPIAGAGAVVPVLYGMGQGERPGTAQLTGIGIAVVGVMLAGGPEFRIPDRRRPVVLAAAAGVCFGAVYVFLREGSRIDVTATLLVMRLTSVLAIAGVLLVAGLATAWSLPRSILRTGFSFSPRDGAVIAAVGWLDVAANGLFAVASRSGMLSVVAVLASLYPAVTVVLARLLDHERLRRGQAVGVALVLASVPMLAA
ncbi:MAG: DMT family transporter [Acidothermus sp.]|nr:DMT family transporter [Acidothermus sp.]MCL6537129.1 DMT family transporter [Acidothermus sp.]